MNAETPQDHPAPAPTEEQIVEQREATEEETQLFALVAQAVSTALPHVERVHTNTSVVGLERSEEDGILKITFRSGQIEWDVFYIGEQGKEALKKALAEDSDIVIAPAGSVPKVKG